MLHIGHHVLTEKEGDPGIPGKEIRIKKCGQPVLRHSWLKTKAAQDMGVWRWVVYGMGFTGSIMAQLTCGKTVFVS